MQLYGKPIILPGYGTGVYSSTNRGTPVPMPHRGRAVGAADPCWPIPGARSSMSCKKPLLM